MYISILTVMLIFSSNNVKTIQVGIHKVIALMYTETHLINEVIIPPFQFLWQKLHFHVFQMTLMIH